MERKRLLLLAYRVLAYITGVWLLLLAFVAMPVKYLVNPDTVLMPAIAIPHGYIYMVYVLVALALALTSRWGVLKTLGVLISGTIPFLSFVAERKVVAGERQAEAESESLSKAGPEAEGKSGGKTERV